MVNRIYYNQEDEGHEHRITFCANHLIIRLLHGIVPIIIRR